MTSKTAAEQTVEHGRIRQVGRQAKTPAKDGTQARAVGSVWSRRRQQWDMERLARAPQVTIVGGQHVWSTPVEKARAASTALMKPVTPTDGRIQMVQRQKKISMAARRMRAAGEVKTVRYIERKITKKEGYKDGSRTSRRVHHPQICVNTHNTH